VAESWGIKVEANGDAKRTGILGYYRHDQAISLSVKSLDVWAHELVHLADDRRGELRGATKVDREVVAELGAVILLEILGYTKESNRGFAWDYVRDYCRTNKSEPLTVCRRLLDRACGCVALIMDTADAMTTGKEVQ
jgi:hypothetical protein